MSQFRTPVSVEHIRGGDCLFAIIVSSSFCEPGIRFFTEADLSQQLAYMRHPTGKTIAPHFHNFIQREVYRTQEVLFIKRGRIRVDFYGSDRTLIDSRILKTGDTIMLVSGGHGFETLEETEMIEVKQGPYTGVADKTTFDPV